MHPFLDVALLVLLSVALRKSRLYILRRLTFDRPTGTLATLRSLRLYSVTADSVALERYVRTEDIP